MIKAIFFDLQGVLTKNGRMFSEQLPKAWEPEVQGKETVRRYYEFRVKKKIDKKKFFKGIPKRKQHAFLKLSKPHAGAREAVKKLSKKYPLYIASNHIDFIFEKEIQQLRVKKYFRKLFVSKNLGVAKPSEEFYKKMLKGAKVTAKESIFVDDSKINLAAAKKLGITTVWVKNKNEKQAGMKKFKPDFEITSIMKLVKIARDLEAN